MNNVYLALLSIVAWGVGSVFYKIASDSLHPMMVSTIVTSVYLVLVPLSLIFIKFDHYVAWSPALFAAAGATCMAVGSLAYFFALKTGAAGEITALTSLSPALTLTISCFFLGEQINLKKIVGIGLALASVIVLSRK